MKHLFLIIATIFSLNVFAQEGDGVITYQENKEILSEYGYSDNNYWEVAYIDNEVSIGYTVHIFTSNTTTPVFCVFEQNYDTNQKELVVSANIESTNVIRDDEFGYSFKAIYTNLVDGTTGEMYYKEEDITIALHQRISINGVTYSTKKNF